MLQTLCKQKNDLNYFQGGSKSEIYYLTTAEIKVQSVILAVRTAIPENNLSGL